MRIFVFAVGLILIAGSASAQQMVSPIQVIDCGDGFFKKVDNRGRITCKFSTTASPGGGTGAIQYNNGGTFGGVVITGLVDGNGASAPTAYGGTSGAAHEFLTGLSIHGIGTFLRPVCADLSDAGAGCTGSGVTSPGGTTGAFQYNNAGSFGGVVITGLALGNGVSAPSAYAGTSGAAHQWITALSAAGAGTFSRPACADLSDSGPGCTGAAGGITQLTGDVTAGPGSGSQVATLANTAVTPGSYTSTNLTVDSKGRITAAANGTAGGVTTYGAVGWIAGVSPDKVPMFTVSTASTITDIRGRVEVAVGNTATISIFKVASGTACASGTNLINGAGTFNANGSAISNQNLTLAGAGAPSLVAGDTVCLSTANAGNFTSGSGIGGITVTYTVP